MIRQILSAIFLAGLLLEVASQKGPKEIPKSIVGQVAQGQLYKIDNYRSYHLINVNSIEKKYLFFSLTTQEVYEGFNLSMTIYKQGTQAALVRCEKEQFDSCYLFKDQIFLNETLFIVVECDSKEEIQYRIRSYWSDLEHISPGQSIKFIFSEKDQKQIYHLELQGMAFQELRIIIRPETRRYPFDKIKMYGTFGDKSNPSASKYDFKSFPLWEDSEGVYLYRREVKDLNMNLILYGQTKTVYTMSCEIVNKTHGDLGLNQRIYQYLQNQQRYLYHLKFKDQKGTYFAESFVFRVATFTGDLDVRFYKDEKMVSEVEGLASYAYMGDMQYLLNNQSELQKKMPNGIYVSVESVKRVSTYMLEFQGRGKTEALELIQHIYQFLPVKNTEIAYLNVGQYIDEKTKADRFRLVFTDVAVVGRVSLDFRFCKKSLNECLGKSFEQNSDRILPEVKQVGSKITYTLELTQGMFNKVNLVEHRAVIVVVVKNMEIEKVSFSAIEYNVGNRHEFLRENKPIESYVRKQEVKVYKYFCQDPQIKKIKVHINTISGSFNAFALRREPSKQEELNKKYGRVIASAIQFTERLLQQPIIIIISGVDSATYSIVVQTVHSEDSQLSYITLSEDVEFKMKITPNKFQVFEIVPISSSIYFSYKSTGPLHVCRLDESMVCEEQNITTLENEGNVSIREFHDRKAYIKVGNPSARAVEVRSIFHSRQKEHCELVKMGHLVSQLMTVNKCLYSVLDTLQGFEVMLVHQQYGQFEFKTIVCSQLVKLSQQSHQPRYYISTSELQKYCKDHAQYTFSFVVLANLRRSDDKPEPVQTLHVKYIIQYVDSIIVIPDGVGYHSTEPTIQGPIKKFAYNLLNFANTTIVVTTRSKLVFLAKVVQSNQRERVVINFNDKHFSSPTDRYYYFQSIHLGILASQLSKYSCSQCELLIFLYSQEATGQYVDFTIQVTQNFQVLEDGLQKNNYLTQNSKAFYSYHIKKQGEVLVQISDNNQNCAQLYVSRNEYPDENNYDKKSFDGEIVYENKRADPSNLYVSVKARSNCPYTVGASLLEGSIKLKKLQRGVLSPLSLKQGEVRFYTFKHLSSNAFKILSLHKYGSVQFYLNKTTPQAVGSLLKQATVDFQSFQYKSPERNRIHLTQSSQYFCKGCFYILAAVAKKPTDSSLFLADQQTRIPISDDKVINDILPEVGSFSRGQFYVMQKGIMQVKVHSGKLQVDLSYEKQNFSHVFQKNSSIQTYKFQLKLGQIYHGSAQVVFKALSPKTVYSSRIHRQKWGIKNEPKRGQTIVNPAEPNYFYVNGVKETVLKGYFKSKQDRLFISFLSSDKQLLRFMNITGTLQGKPTDISRDITRNVISINFIEAQTASFEKGLPYELIFSLQNKTMSLIAMQTEETNLLPQNVEMLVSGKQTYDIYPEGEFLLDIFECRGSASLSYSKTRAGLQGQKEKVLQSYSMPDQPHAVKIEQGYTNMLIRVTSQLALIRWLPINRQKQTGLGYYLFKAGSLKYDSVFGSIDFVIQPLQKATQKSKTKIKSIRYNLYVSSSEQDLKEASLCERYLPASVIEYRTIHQQVFTSSFRFSIDKNKLVDKYKLSENLFATIVADLTLTLPDSSSQEYYRFVYNQQQIPKELFTPSKLESFEVISISIFLLLAIVAMLVLAWLCTKVFVPMIGRLRNRMLIEQHGENSNDKDIEIKEEQIEPPPSSERQNIVVAQTDEQMEQPS